MKPLDGRPQCVGHSQQWQDGRRNGIKWAVEYLQVYAHKMNDPHAKLVLDMVGTHMGMTAKRRMGEI